MGKSKSPLSSSPSRQQVGDIAAWQAKCDSEYNQAYDGIQKNQEEYDKQLITLSAAFLTLTISFIGNIVPLKEAIHRGLLYAALVLMAGCLVSVLISYQVSIHFHYRVAEYWKQKKDPACAPQFPDHGATIVRCWNISNGMLFASGVILTVAFVIWNIHVRGSEVNKVMTAQHILDGVPAGLPGEMVDKGRDIKIPSDDYNPPAVPAPTSQSNPDTQRPVSSPKETQK
jgi:hypothetical protein